MPQPSAPQQKRNSPPQTQRLLRWYAGLDAVAGVLLVVVALLPSGSEPATTAEQADLSAAQDGEGRAERPARTDGAGRVDRPEQEGPDAVGDGRPEASRGGRPAGVARPRRPEPEPGYKGTIAIVVDDVGHSLSELEPFLQFKGPITFAVLPQREFSEEAARRAAAAGKEVILHLPMEPVSDMDPGPGAIRVDMTPEEIARTIRRNVESVPGAGGVNNHMGSRATADAAVMDAVLSTLKEEGLYFLDSRTSADTVGRRTAEKHNLPYLERAVFLDNENNRDYIRNAVREGMQIAERKGHAVMIGHVMVNELVEVLNEMYPFIQDEGFDLRYLSELVLSPEFDDDPRS